MSSLPKSKKKLNIGCIGGGLSGALAAIAFQRSLGELFDLSFIVFERHADPAALQEQHHEPCFLSQYDARNIVLSSATIEYLKQLDLWQSIQDILVPIHQLKISKNKSLATSEIHAETEGVDALGYVADLSRLSLCFQRLAQHAKFEFGARLRRLKPLQNGYEITYQIDEKNEPFENQGSDNQYSMHSKSITVDFLIAADGQNTWVGKQLGVQRVQKNYHQKALVCNIDMNVEIAQTAFERFLKQGAITLLPLNHKDHPQRMSMVWIDRSEVIDDYLNMSDQDFLGHLNQAMAPSLLKEKLMIRSLGARKTYPLAFQQLVERVRPRCVFIGNSSQTLHPIAAQGFNLAVRDIRDLTRHLSDELKSHHEFPVPGALQRFDAHRSKDIARVKTFVDTLIRLFFSTHALPPGVEYGVQSIGILLFELVPGAKPTLSRFAMGGKSRSVVGV